MAPAPQLPARTNRAARQPLPSHARPQARNPCAAARAPPETTITIRCTGLIFDEIIKEAHQAAPSPGHAPYLSQAAGTTKIRRGEDGGGEAWFLGRAAQAPSVRFAGTWCQAGMPGWQEGWRVPCSGSLTTVGAQLRTRGTRHVQLRPLLHPHRSLRCGTAHGLPTHVQPQPAKPPKPAAARRHPRASCARGCACRSSAARTGPHRRKVQCLSHSGRRLAKPPPPTDCDRDSAPTSRARADRRGNFVRWQATARSNPDRKMANNNLPVPKEASTQHLRRRGCGSLSTRAVAVAVKKTPCCAAAMLATSLAMRAGLLQASSSR